MSHLTSLKKEQTWTHCRTPCLFSLRSSCFYCYDLPVISFQTSVKFQSFSLKKKRRCSLRSSGQLSLRTPCFFNFWLIFVISNSRSLNSELHVFFLMSGDRNEHMLPEIVMKSWCEMSHSHRKINIRRLDILFIRSIMFIWY